MKKTISAFLFFFILGSCGGKKEVVSNNRECKVVIFPSEDLTSEYKTFYSYSYFNINQFANFDKTKNGILLYRWDEGHIKSTFLIVDFDRGFNAVKKREDSTEAVIFSLEEKNNLKNILEILKKESYYQSCTHSIGHSSLYVLIIRHNNEKIVQYYSPLHSPYNIDILDANIKLVQEVFGIMDHGYYR